MKKFLSLVLIFFIPLSAWSLCDGASEKMNRVDPIDGQNFEIEAKVFRPISTGAFPVIFILPPVVGETPLDASFAFNLCLNGIGAYVLNVLNDPSPEAQVQDLNTHEDGLIRAEFAVGEFIANLQKDAEVSENFGILGASLGAIVAGYLLGDEPLLKAGVIIAGGGNIAHILAQSDQESVKLLRQRRLKEFNLPSAKAYEDFIRPYITRDPLILAKQIQPSSVFIFITKFDIDVPTSDQRIFANSLSNPKVIELNNTHIPGIVEASTVFQDEIINFFKDKLL